MIIIIDEEYRSIVEQRFGSIVKYKKFIQDRCLYVSGVNYGALLQASESLSAAIYAMSDSIFEAYRTIINNLTRAFKPILDSLAEFAKELPEIPLILPQGQSFMHPDKNYPKIVKSIGKSHTSPTISRKTEHRCRSNC